MKISALYYYPIKSCGGWSLTEGQLTPRGLAHDRSFMLVDDEGRFLTQRTLPQMALVTPFLDDKTLTLAAPNISSLTVDIQTYGAKKDVIVWGDSCKAIDQGHAAAEWFSSFLRIRCRLVRMADDFQRTVDPAYAQRPTDQAGFADAYPNLLISQASLDDLNTRLPHPVSMNRFRPNIVVNDTRPFAEDTWREIRVGNVQFDVVKPCARCAVTTVEQSTGVKGVEPLKTLASYRTSGGKVMFGQNILHQTNGIIRVGDTVEILR